MEQSNNEVKQDFDDPFIDDNKESSNIKQYDYQKDLLVDTNNFLRKRNSDLYFELIDKNELVEEKEMIIDHLREKNKNLSDLIVEKDRNNIDNNKIIDDLQNKLNKKNDVIIKLRKNNNYGSKTKSKK